MGSGWLTSFVFVLGGDLQAAVLGEEVLKAKPMAMER
jgi:hypothetical protein